MLRDSFLLCALLWVGGCEPELSSHSSPKRSRSYSCSPEALGLVFSPQEGEHSAQELQLDALSVLPRLPDDFELKVIVDDDPWPGTTWIDGGDAWFVPDEEFPRDAEVLLWAQWSCVDGRRAAMGGQYWTW